VQKEMIDTFVEAGYYFVGHGNYRGPGDPPSKLRFDVADRANLADNILKKVQSLGETEPYLNVWGSLDPNANDGTLFKKKLL
jgi:hypothetical protein